ncbi:hypothetical protein QBC43DRAFT_114133 [Cladorrhinum sp. PSN259]|nr:hypothetical protein QBC43DRAFT_114133 [Cladorrhinum sp. PSN259]
MSSIESAPLLSTPGHGPIHLPLHNGGETSPPKRHLIPRIGAWLHVLIAPAVAALGIVVAVKYSHSPRHYSLAWHIIDALPWAIITAFWSLGTLVRYRASKKLLALTPIALAFHLLVGEWALEAAVKGFDLFNWGGQCQVYKWPEPPVVDEDCMKWRTTFEPWVWAYLILLVVFAAVHIILALTYAVYAFQASREAWQKREQWRGGDWGVLVPAYAFTVEFTVRVGRPAPAPAGVPVPASQGEGGS